MPSVTRKRLAIALAVALAALVAGTQLAGAQDGAQSGSPPVVPEPLDLCSLVTEAEAQAALGYPVVRTSNGSGCSYTVSDPGHFASLAVALGPAELTAETLAEAAAVYARAANAELRPIAATGDGAWAMLGERIDQLIARRGQRSLALVLLNAGTSADERAATLTDLARTALERM
jgi:hypothetical protein